MSQSSLKQMDFMSMCSLGWRDSLNSCTLTPVLFVSTQWMPMEIASEKVQIPGVPRNS